MAELYNQVKYGQSEYVPQFIGSNYDQLEKIGSTLDDRYRRNKQLTDQVEIALAQDKLLAGDEGIRQRLGEKFNSDIDLIASSPKNFENSTNAAMQIAKDYATDPARQVALQNYQKFQESEKIRNGLKAAGHTVLDFSPIDKFKGTVDPETGKLNHYVPDVQQQQNYSGTMQDLLGKVADDGYVTSPKGEKLKFDETERNLIKSGQVNLLTKEKLNKLVESLLPAYKSTSAGTQDLRRLAELEGVGSDAIKLKSDDGKSFRETTPIDEHIRQRFRALAAPQAFQKTMQKWDDFGETAAAKAKLQVPTNIYAPTSPSAVTENSSLAPLPDAEDNAYTSKEGNNFYQWVNKQSGQPLAKEANPMFHNSTDAQAIEDLTNNYTKVKIDPAQVETEMQSNYNKLKNDLPQLGYKNYQDFKDSYKEAIKNHAKITPTGSVIQDEQKKLYKGPANDPSTPIYLPDGKDGGLSLQAFAKKYGIEPEDIEFEPQKSITESPKADMPGGYVDATIVWKGKKGDRPANLPLTAFRPISNEYTAAVAPIDNLYKNSFYRGSDVYNKSNPYDISQEFGIPITDKAGNSIVFATTTYPLPKSQQKSGQPAFRTVVYQGTKVPNGSGGYDVNYDDSHPLQIGAWKDEMKSILGNRIQQVLNNGYQNYNTKDYKEQGLNDY